MTVEASRYALPVLPCLMVLFVAVLAQAGLPMVSLRRRHLFPEDVNPMSYDITRSQFDRPTIGWPLPVTTIRTMNGVRRRVLILGRKL